MGAGEWAFAKDTTTPRETVRQSVFACSFAIECIAKLEVSGSPDKPKLFYLPYLWF
jgi:hypothetical protein